jgi:hypothetical protein
VPKAHERDVDDAEEGGGSREHDDVQEEAGRRSHRTGGVRERGRETEHVAVERGVGEFEVDRERPPRERNECHAAADPDDLVGKELAVG